MSRPAVMGKKLGTIEAVKASLKRGAGGAGGTYIKHVGEDGVIVRFLTDPEEWFGYREYYDAENKQFMPMVTDEILPDGVRPSFRYLTNALDIENDRVIPLKLAKTCANLLMIKYEKYGTVTDRNYELDRHGTGLDTTYDVTPQGPTKVNTDKYDLFDLAVVLENARRVAEGDDPFDTNAPITMGDADDIDTDDDEESISEWGNYSEDDLFPNGEYREDYSVGELEAIGRTAAVELVAIAEDWDEDTEASDTMSVEELIKIVLEHQGGDEATADEESAEEEVDEELVIDEDELLNMGIRDLRKLAETVGVDHAGLKKQALIDTIIEAAEA